MNTQRWTWIVLFILAASTSIGLGVAVAQDDDDEGEAEEVVTMDEVPAAVKATILTEVMTEVPELRLLELERETENGVVVYEAEFQFNDRRFELEISPEGELLEKETGEDEKEDDDV